MVPIMNVPFLERTLRRLKDAGIDDIILPAGYLPEAITSYFGDGTALGLKIRYVIEAVPLGTAGALKNVEQYIDGPFFVLNGDVLTSLDLRAMLDYHRAKGGIGTMHLIRVEDPSPFGVAVHDANGRIERFVEKPKREDAPSNEINAGTYILDRAVLDLIPTGRAVSIERVTFPQIIAIRPGALRLHDRRLLDRSRPPRGVPRRAPAHLRRCDAVGDAPGHRRPGPRRPSPPSAVRPPVFVGHDCRIAPDAVVGPYTVLGDGCEVQSGAVVADSLLWDGVTIETGAQLTGRSSPAAREIGAGARIGRGSVIGHGARIPAGRQVEDNARIAVEHP